MDARAGARPRVDLRLRLFGPLRPGVAATRGPAAIALLMEGGRTGEVVVSMRSAVRAMTSLEFWGRWKGPCQFFDQER